MGVHECDDDEHLQSPGCYRKYGYVGAQSQLGITSSHVMRQSFQRPSRQQQIRRPRRPALPSHHRPTRPEGPTAATAAPETGKSKKKSNTGPIVGGIVGGIIVLALIGLLAFFCVRRSKNKRSGGVRVSDPNSSPLMMDQKGDAYHNGGLATPMTAPYGTPYSPPPGISPYPQESFVQKPYVRMLSPFMWFLRC